MSAPPEVREAVGLLDDFSHNAVCRPVTRRRAGTGDPPTAHRPARLWLGTDEFTLNIGKIGRDMSELHAEIVRIIGRQTGEKVPSIPCTVLVDRWHDIESLVLRPFIAG